MKRPFSFFLLPLLIFCAPLASAQIGNTSMLLFPGVPSGTCQSLQLGLNMANGNLYSCNNGTWALAGASGGGIAGTDTEVEYNKAGVFGADANLEWNYSTEQLVINGTVNAATGYQIGSAAASGNYLRGNGTNFVSSPILAADLPVGATSGNASFVEDFISSQAAVTLSTSAAYLGDTEWDVGPITAGTTGTLAATNGTFQNPGEILITTPAVSGDGAFLFKTNSATASALGVLGASAG